MMVFDVHYLNIELAVRIWLTMGNDQFIYASC